MTRRGWLLALSLVVLLLGGGVGVWWGTRQWQAEEDRRHPLVVVAAGCLLLMSLVASVFVSAIGTFFLPLLPTPEWVLHLATFAASFIVVTLLFAAIYKLLPDVRLRWSDVLTGAAVTSFLFTIGKQLLAIYLGRVGFQSTYGAAWTVVIVLVWVYYSAQLFFLGAEFTKVYTRNYGSQRGLATAPVPGVTKTAIEGPT